jgi:CheY-like chemotaxis protein/MinD-like ATPase involved in chromosome partitioning or flagellar assembly
MSEKILVVDDDIDTLRLVGLMLQRQGYQVVAASNGNQALIMAQSENPDLVLLDVMMPDMDGYEVARRLRANPSTNSTPIIMFTAKSQVDDKIMGFESGVDDYLTKPTQPRELFAHVKAVLARSNKQSPPPPETSPRERGHVIGVLAARGGIGVSTLAINLGISLRALTSKEVVVADFRPGEGTISLDLGYLNPEGFPRILQKKASEISITDVEAELITHKSDVRLLMSTYKPCDASLITEVEKFDMVAKHLAHLGSFVVLDLGPVISPITNKVLETCDELIVVLEPTPFTVTRSQLLIEELTSRGFGEGRLNVVLYNRMRTEMQLSLTQVQGQFKYPITLVFTPAPELAYQASRNNFPIAFHKDNLTAQQFAKLAEIITKHVRVT